jgi:hypothetical protein
VVGKNLLPENEKMKYGQYPSLGKKLKNVMPHATLTELAEAGHIPHIQVPSKFRAALFGFLE